MGDERSFSGKGVFPSKYAFTLLIPFRKLILSPKKLLKQIKPEADSIILEVGPGPGFFSIEVARAIPEGKLVLFDIQGEMLDKAEKRLKRKGINNVEFVKSDGEQFPFPDKKFDIIFLVTVLGEVENRDLYLIEFRRILKDGGEVSISEQAGDPDLMTIEELETLFSNNEFKLIEKIVKKFYYTLIFKKN